MKKRSVTPLRLGSEILLVTLCLTYMLSMFLLYSGIGINSWIFPSSLVLSIVIGWFSKGELTEKTFILTAISVMAFVVVSILFAIPVSDYSYDGNMYHQEIVALLTSGWNPVETSVPSDEISLWARHYAKALEVIESAVVSCVGLIESGKAVNLMLVASAAGFVYDFLHHRFPELSARSCCLITAVALANPVCMAQLPTFYIDFGKYIYTMLAIVLLIEWGSFVEPRRNLMLLCVVICLAAGTKFNAFFEMGVVVFAACLWLAMKRDWRRVWVLASVAALAAIISVVVAWHPYITNLIDRGHPLYPLMGAGAVDIMTGNTPPVFEGHSRVVNFMISVAYPGVPTYDNRIGGFGPFMLLMLIISAYWIIRYRRVAGALPVYICVWIMVSCFFFDESWWARYISQLWLLLPIAALTAFRAGRRCRLLLALAFLTGLTGLGLSTFKGLYASCYRSAVCDASTEGYVIMSKSVTSISRHFEEKGLKIVEVSGGVETADCDTLSFWGLTSSASPYIYVDKGAAGRIAAGIPAWMQRVSAATSR